MPVQFLKNTLDELDDRIKHDPDIGPELFARLMVAEREGGLLHDTRPLCPFLRPHIIPRSQYDAVCRAAEVLAGAFERLVEAALVDDALMAEFGLSPRELATARMNPGYKRLCVTSRLDSFCTDDGFFFIEYNAESPAGIPDQALMEKIFYQLPYLREFLETHPHHCPSPQPRLLESLVNAYHDWGGTKERPNIAIVDWKGVATEGEFRLLKAYFESQGHESLITDPYSLEYDGKGLRAGDFDIDIFYKRVIIHEFLEQFDETHPLVRAYSDGNVCMANSFRAKIAHKKAGFALIGDERYAGLFTSEELDVIRRHVPWTKRVREGKATFDGKEWDLTELIRLERDRFVLKPNDDYGGHGVVIGWDASPAEWDSAIETALSHDYVVQERVPIQKVQMPMFTDKLETHDLNVDFNPFLFNNRAEGAMIRLSSSSIVNVSSGGGETALLVLENC